MQIYVIGNVVVFLTYNKLLKNVPSELNKYVTNKELQRSDDSIFCVELWMFWYFTK
jgi:hypothetical protein